MSGNSGGAIRPSYPYYYHYNLDTEGAKEVVLDMRDQNLQADKKDDITAIIFYRHYMEQSLELGRCQKKWIKFTMLVKNMRKITLEI